MWSYLRVPKGGVFIDVGAHIGKYNNLYGQGDRR
jgi:hypothetical protein